MAEDDKGPQNLYFLPGDPDKRQKQVEAAVHAGCRMVIGIDPGNEGGIVVCGLDEAAHLVVTAFYQPDQVPSGGATWENGGVVPLLPHRLGRNTR